MEVLRPYIRLRSYDGQFVVTAKGPLARGLQKTVGDVLFNADSETVYSIEVKTEERNNYGNLFLETWSNRSRFTLGWMFTLSADLLLYHFIEDNIAYRLNFDRLRRWAFHDNRIYAFPEKPQAKYKQRNDTYGRCVPIADLEREVGAKKIHLPPAEAAA